MDLYWKECLNQTDLIDFVDFERENFNPEDCSPIADYENWIQTKNLRIFILATIPYSIVGTFTVFEEDDVFYMGGFAIALQYRGHRISYLLTEKLINTFKHKKIVCKTQALDKKMRRVMLRGNFKNRLDIFEKGKCWSWWEHNENEL
jgi:hypothetical protein